MHNLMSSDGTEASESSAKILIGICSCQAFPDKRQAVRESWLAQPVAGIEHLFFVGGTESLADECDTVVLGCDDSYDHLPTKVLAFFAHALAVSDFEWLFKCDDDTYLALDRLHELISPDHELVGNDMHMLSRGSPSGGAGYLLSRRIVERLVADTGLSRTGPEDMIIGEAAVRHGAAPLASDRLRWDASNFPDNSNSIVTAHWCSPDKLRAIHSILHSTPSRRFNGIHNEWVDEVHLHADGVFRRKSSGCCGLWEEDTKGRLALRWFDWGEEVLEYDGSAYCNPKLRMNELGDERFHAKLRSAEKVPYVNIRPRKADPKILYFSPVGLNCLKLVAATSRIFRSAGADLRLVAYGNHSIRYPGLKIQGPARGGKWQIAKDWLKPEEVADYDYLFIWDDDVRIESFQPLEFSKLMRFNCLDVAQPAVLSPHCISHEITRPAPLPEFAMEGHRAVGRVTNFVEVMVPVFSRQAWKDFHPFISEANRTGWGYDYFPFKRRGIVDSMTIEHTRPVGSAGNEAFRDLEVFLAQHGLVRYQPCTSGYLLGPNHYTGSFDVRVGDS